MHSFMLHVCLSGIPDSSEEDLSVARALNLRWTTVLNSHEDGTQTLINSQQVSAGCHSFDIKHHFLLNKIFPISTFLKMY